MGSRPFTLIASIIFALVAIIHVVRLFTHFHMVVGTHVVPLWASWVCILVAAILAWGTYRESRR
jgi:protein-S-isoprenylcysteine O-methyltransferase Ste14